MTARFSLNEAERVIYRKYASLALPRHTSYPIAPIWKESYGASELQRDLATSSDNNRDLSIYVHVPFCEQLCYYCACTKEIVPSGMKAKKDPGVPYLESLEQEIEHYSKAATGTVKQIHLGGGTPTFLDAAGLEKLWNKLSSSFSIAPDAEIAIEVDPVVTTVEHIKALRSFGFNRISLGVQDFDPQVQKAVNRVQSVELVSSLVEKCRGEGFESINFDLIYGLPFQTLDSMKATLEKVRDISPDRIAFYRLAVIPDIFKWQKLFKEGDLPSNDLPLDLNLLAINFFTECGYEFVGLDHFAKPSEDLVSSLESGSIRRTFQGMTTGKGLDILGFGPSSICQLDDAFAQNPKKTSDWAKAVGAGFATDKGLHLSGDDRLRRELLQQLYCYGRIDKKVLSTEFNVVFDEYFSDELAKLQYLIKDQIVELSKNEITAKGLLGRLLVRVVASVFDKYLPPNAFREGLKAHQSSKVG